MSRTMLVTVSVLAMSGSAMAETATELRTAILQCKPSCYERAQFDGPAKKIKVCAYLPIHFTQDKRGKKWSKLERSSAMSPIAVPSCKFPKTVPVKWKAVVAEARKQLDLAKGDFATVAADFGDWRYEKDDLDRVTARDVIIDHYSRGHEDFDRCRGGDPFATCEGENNEVTSFNTASYRVTEARKLKRDGNHKDCRAATWDAVRQTKDAKKERERFTKEGSWQSRTYATRYDGLMNEKALYAKIDVLESEAIELWGQCGGKGEPPMD